MFLLVWRDRYPHDKLSDPRARRVIVTSETDGFTETERTKFQVVERADLSEVKPYEALNADDLKGPLLTLHEDEAPEKTVLDPETKLRVPQKYTKAEIAAKV